jgi:hypothetical protein
VRNDNRWRFAGCNEHESIAARMAAMGQPSLDAMLADARAAGAAAERARIVAWLRAGHCKTMADAIERGAHKEPRP